MCFVSIRKYKGGDFRSESFNAVLWSVPSIRPSVYKHFSQRTSCAIPTEFGIDIFENDEQITFEHEPDRTIFIGSVLLVNGGSKNL